MADIFDVHVDLRYSTVYQCGDCGMRAVAKGIVSSFSSHDGSDISERIRGIPQTAHHMPYGWRSTGAGFFCSKCTPARDEKALAQIERMLQGEPQ